ncbi:MAG: orotidine 5'-phosphate decarboxylase [Propionicimonas sp.]
MKLQLALDLGDLDSCLALAERTRSSVDIIEVGTPLVLRYGMAGVREFRAAFPDKEILADLKIADGGYYETALAVEAGADFVTALALADSETLRECVRATRDLGGQLFVDLLCVPELSGRVRELLSYGVSAIAVHTGTDQQSKGRTPLEDLREVSSVDGGALVAVAGGINRQSIADYVQLNPDVVIVGSGITQAADPAAAAAELHAVLRTAEPAAQPLEG